MNSPQINDHTYGSYKSPSPFRLFLFFLLVFIFSVKIGWVIPDGVGYTAYLASLFLDGDIHLMNQYKLTGIIAPHNIYGAIVTRTGYIFSFWGIGNSLLLMTFWLLGHALTAASTLFGQNWAAHGFSVYYNLGVRFAGAIMGMSALTCMFVWMKHYTNARLALITAALVTIGTPYWWYLFPSGDGSHVPASLGIALFVLIWDLYRSGVRNRRIAFLIGLVGGFVTIIKPNNVIIFLFPLALWISEWKQKDKSKLEILWIAFGAVVPGALQLWIWQILFGNPLGSILDRGVTYHYSFFAGSFRLIDILFSSYHGLFYFSPLLLFTFYGFIRRFRKDRLLAGVSLTILLFQLCLMASERFFWEGAAFGLRRVVDWTPLFAMGIAWGLLDMKGIRWIAPSLATLWTVLLMFTYSRMPTSVLNEYQTTSQITEWMADALIQLPSRLISFFAIPLPLKILIPGLFIFSIPGYLLLKLIMQITSSYEKRFQNSDTLQIRPFYVLMSVLIILIGAGYVLMARATVNRQVPVERYAQELKILEENQDRIEAQEETEFLLREGRYLGLTRGWEKATGSFREAYLSSQKHPAMPVRIRRLIRPYMTREEADRYVEEVISNQ